MFESDKIQGHVRPIKFQSINEDDHNQANQWRRSKTNTSTTMATNPHEYETPLDATLRRRIVSKPNYSFEYAYPAVILEDVCFSVDRSKQQANFLKECLYRLKNCLAGCDRNESQDKVQILKSVNLNVPYGSIFGLLGPSSCGKTTILRCLAGLLKPSSGSIRLFGKNASSSSADGGSKLSCSALSTNRGRSDCKVPGSNVGYMPQDLGLYEDFTIKQLLTMFGRYMRMESKLIETRIEFMAKFLELPHVDREIQTLSGGQKRRVSFAIACIHMPPLIILDEPTVGVDPLLRRSIWKYLRRLASEENRTIIITTHYIEEAAQADQVALMRAGEVLVQDTPAKIMQSNNSRTLEEAFLKICNNVRGDQESQQVNKHKIKLLPQPQFNWQDELDHIANEPSRQLGTALGRQHDDSHEGGAGNGTRSEDSVMQRLKLKAQEKLAIYDKLRCCQQPEMAHTTAAAAATGATTTTTTTKTPTTTTTVALDHEQQPPEAATTESDNLSMTPDAVRQRSVVSRQPRMMNQILGDANSTRAPESKTRTSALLKRGKFTLNDSCHGSERHIEADFRHHGGRSHETLTSALDRPRDSLPQRLVKSLTLFWALLYKNYRRNVNSIPLLVFQFMLPMIQMISFSLCVGGRPTNVGLGIVNHDNPISFAASASDASDFPLDDSPLLPLGTNATLNDLDHDYLNDSLSLRYLSFIDKSMLSLQPYDQLSEALADVRKAKLWAVLEIGENFTTSIAKRFDLENFYQLDLITIRESVIKLYPDRSNKILDMICHRSLVDSYRKFISDEFEHFKRLPIEIARPIFDIKSNAISNSIDGYTESISPGLLASLTYIMAAGLTTFIMVVERSAGILERTYTSGINPISYLLAHALFRSLVMMIQIAFVLILTFYVLQQPLVGSIWLAYSMLMVLNVTGISYGLLVSSIVTDQNGAALTIVSSLVVKITLSGILWPFEAIPLWLRTICYIQPLTMPVQALKAITLKGAGLGDRAVNLGFLVSITWLLVFLTISTKRFKFYQH